RRGRSIKDWTRPAGHCSRLINPTRGNSSRIDLNHRTPNPNLPCLDVHADAHEVGEPLRAGTLHHPGAVVLHGFWADVEPRSDFLGGQCWDTKITHLALPLGHLLDARIKLFRLYLIQRFLACDLQCITNAGEKPSLVERLFDKIERAALDGENRHVDIPMP